MASTAADVSVTSLAKGPPAATSCSKVAPSGVPDPAPSWFSTRITSARCSVDPGRDAVDGVDGIAEVKLSDPGGSDEGRHFLGHGADDGHLDAAQVEDSELRQCGLGGALFVDVGTQVGELGVAAARGDAVVLASMRPWKSLMPKKFRSTVAGVTGAGGRSRPTTTGSGHWPGTGPAHSSWSHCCHTCCIPATPAFRRRGPPHPPSASTKNNGR
jgi:hypothetical protein